MNFLFEQLLEEGGGATSSISGCHNSSDFWNLFQCERNMVPKLLDRVTNFPKLVSTIAEKQNFPKAMTNFLKMVTRHFGRILLPWLFLRCS